MTYNKRLFTSESVTEGHPDKIADQVSDAILDEILKDDPNARVACETTVTTGMALISGEISTTTYVDIPKVVRETIKDIGYTRAKYGYDSQTMAVLTAIDEQSPDIAQGVDKALEYRNDISEEEIEATGAGDQGLMFGYATDETDTYMPLPIFLSHQLAKRLADVRKDEILDYLRPDGKVQVTVEYGEDDKPRRIDTIVVSTQHAEDVELAQIEKDIKTHVIYPTVDKALLDDETKFYINPTGRFVIGGPQGDAGLTGRKIIVDTYGGYARHGGGCFSGKDPTKVDRSAAYAARYVAKNIVAAGLAKQCEVQLAYAIGVAEPVSISINTFDTGKVSEARLVEAVRKHFDLRPAGIIKMLDLKQPIYRQTAAYGHFGRTDVLLPWEKLDKVNVLKDAVEIQ
ncbi:methionine adenosyltransferase [Staphylococcus epidermidis]|mgnify:FL=1|jgi:methionine adenosyltransferase|uniref:S-adenosylmethionine synthase n=16 Tax=root TaxID=1 RepID=METK_STAEQ|nr:MULTISPECIES: methionine adenosyltransferase [Staphylococcus]Q5HNB8.1 RecName: Full=S-adenosylmethionine synthase; Short=AdoMet synthase; AltName: Full=MAT; AltName: Full=Methionine adenosyltransferase [Staphylococcus epidermidis RP62A]Q8CNT5.1 RecName: Full=S-adenosylmethionine synthase; Short=AdoMet synthase; AltName: Full=MAT; AltName: Full=Methionine adenosyltransferase [Staphylococcus epidermidis ATCC 12228]EHQ75222.1 methionine adenosyltransferase [Staphylococcus epidermidis VCU057]EHR